MVRIAIDCMGGDHGLPVTVPAAVAYAAQNPSVSFILVGDQAQVQQTLQAQKISDLSRFEIVHASEAITMEDSVEVALRRKKDSSMRVAAQLVKDGKADAFISAGNTGALMAVARYVLKTIDGIDRPAIATSIPTITPGKSVTMLDLGANVDCTPKHLLEFAIMGRALAQAVDLIENPKIGLLNIGEEVIKGNDTVKAASLLLKNSNLNFTGNVEGDGIFRGEVNVVVCDGFVGNVVLKSMEGLAKMIGGMIKQGFTANPYAMVAGLVAKPVLNNVAQQIDGRKYNGAALLGLKGIVFKSHGSADIEAYTQALARTYQAAHSGLLEKITAKVVEMRSQIDSADNTPVTQQ